MLTVSEEIAMEVVPGPRSVVLTTGDEPIKTDMTSVTPIPKTAPPTADALVDAFLEHVDFGQLLSDIFKYHVSLLKTY